MVNQKEGILYLKTPYNALKSFGDQDVSREVYGKSSYHISAAKCQRLHGLRQSIARRELTTALEILEVAGHKDQDANDALNLYRGVSHA